MNLKNYESLDIDKKIELLNKLLKTNSINKISNMFNLNKTKFKHQFDKFGYCYDFEGKFFKKKEVEGMNERKENINLNEEMYKGILELIGIKDKLMQIVEKNDSREVVRIDTDEFEGSELKSKSIKVYEKVLNEFNTFMQKHPELKQQEVLSQAIWEFVQKYN